jgi:hypothetical protein
MTDGEREAILQNGSIDDVYMAESLAAGDAGDEDSAWSWMALMELPATALLMLRNSRGGQYLRDMRFKTTAADVAYGPGWLDQRPGWESVLKKESSSTWI